LQEGKLTIAGTSDMTVARDQVTKQGMLGLLDFALAYLEQNVVLTNTKKE
jgi:hypothetical protein